MNRLHPYSNKSSKRLFTTRGQRKIIVATIIVALVVLVVSVIILIATKNQQNVETANTVSNTSIQPQKTYKVESIVDGDTIKINYDGEIKTIRIIGINTPETVDPRKPVECFGQEASEFTKRLLEGKEVSIESDPTQSDVDKYGRLLRYVYLNNEDVGLRIISEGYGYEYTYNTPYNKQGEYKKAQLKASENGKGLWANGACNTENIEGYSVSSGQITDSSQSNSNADCVIKGNISSSGERIYHVPGQQYYDQTIIDTNSGERWFCSEDEAEAAGWRKSKV